MRTSVDIAADLAAHYGGPDFDVLGFAADYQRAQPKLATLDAEEFMLPDNDPIEGGRIKRRDAALVAVIAELRMLEREPTATCIAAEWKRYLGSDSARRWRGLGGPDFDANELDAKLYLLTVLNRGEALSTRRLREWLAERAVEARSGAAGA